MREDHVPTHRRLWLFAVAGLTLTFLVLPVLIVIPISFSASSLLEFPPRAYSLRWYQGFFGSVEWLDATWMSVQVAVLTTIVVTPLGVAAAYGLHLAGLRFTTL